jgi:glycosyltransferase involved in cell wall biosynthesis/cytochrome c-type biogenesis protein CcmH/NrfG
MMQPKVKPRPRVSLCMIVKDEEKQLGQCLASAKSHVDEIVVIDTGSRDGTVRIAESHGAKVSFLKWNNSFAAARNESLLRATGDWIFYLDADERLSSMGETDCLRKAASVGGIDAYSVPIRSYKTPGSSSEFDLAFNVRLFRNYPGIHFVNEVHERIEPFLDQAGAVIARSRFMVEHFGYHHGSEAFRSKLERNLALSHVHLERAPDDAYALYYLGITHLLLKSNRESRKAFEKALAGKGLTPSLHAILLNLLSYLHLDERQYGRAMDKARKSLSVFPRQQTASLLIGLAHYQGGELKEALPYLVQSHQFLRLPAQKRQSDLSQEHFLLDESELVKAIDRCNEAVETQRQHVERAGRAGERNAERGRAGVRKGRSAEGFGSIPLPTPPFRSPARSPASRSERPDLSVCMIVKNEAQNLAEALTNFQPFADEIIVVDTGSTDDTKAIAQRYTRRVFDFPWTDDFAAARNHSLAQARGRYVLWLDADDRFQDEMAAKINRLKSRFDGRKAFYFLLENVDGTDHPVRCHQLRCLPRGEHVLFQGRVHEQILPGAVRAGLSLVKTDIVVRHHGYSDPVMHRKKMERNLSILQKEITEGSDDGSRSFFLALTHEALGNWPQATDSMERAIQALQRGNQDQHLIVEGYLFLGRVYEKSGDAASSLRSIVRAEALARENPQHFLHLGLLHQKLGRHLQALACLERSLGREPAPELYPSRPMPAREEIFLIMAYSLFCMGQGSDALQRMDMALGLGMGAFEAQEFLAYKAMALDNPNLAVHFYEAAERLGELDADGYCNLGTLYKRAGLRDKAHQCYHNALGLDSSHTNTLANLAHLQLRQGNLEDAAKLFRQLLENGVEDMDVLLSLALIAAQRDEREELREMERRIEASFMKDRKDRAAYPSEQQEGDFFLILSNILATENRRMLSRLSEQVSNTLRHRSCRTAR